MDTSICADMAHLGRDSGTVGRFTPYTTGYDVFNAGGSFNTAGAARELVARGHIYDHGYIKR